MTSLEAAIYAYMRADSPVITGREFRATFSQLEYDPVKGILEESGYDPSCRDDHRRIEFTLPSQNNSYFALNLDDLLESSARRITPPDEFYIADIEYHHPTTDKIPEVVHQYLNIALLARTFEKLADYSTKGSSPKSIFLQGEKLEFPLSYEKDDIRELPGLGEFLDEFVDADIHKDQKSTIIKSVLLEMLKNAEIDRFTLPCLIKRFNEFRDRVYANYQLYVSEFSFEKIKTEVERDKFEFTIKLNKVFSDIQNQLLAIPVALILVGSQMESANTLIMKNFIVWLSAMMFGIFMSLLIRNQRSNLEAIRTELDAQWKEIEEKHKYVSEKLSHHHAKLEERYRGQRNFLFLISLVITTSIIGSTALLLYRSNAIDDWYSVLVCGSYGGYMYMTVASLYKATSYFRQHWKTPSI